MIDLYTWVTPNGRKVSIMLEETGLEYTAHPIDITQGDQFKPEFQAVSPNNKIPGIVDRETDISMMESGAILLYLAEKTGQFISNDAAKRWSTLEWLMWQMGGLGPIAGQTLHFVKFNPGKSAYAEERFSTELQRQYSVLNERLREREYLADDYSIADIAAWPWVTRFEWQGIDLDDYPYVKRWYLAIASRPAVQKGFHVPKFTQDIPMPG